MQSEEIALELTKAAIEQRLISDMPANDTERNSVNAESMAKAYDIIFKSVNETLAGE